MGRTLTAIASLMCWRRAHAPFSRWSRLGARTAVLHGSLSAGMAARRHPEPGDLCVAAPQPNCRRDAHSCRRPGVSLRVDEGASPCPAGPMSSPDVDGLLVVTPGALDTGVIMPADLSGHNEDHRPGRKPSAQAGAGFTLPEAMTGRASPAKAAVGDKPVFASTASRNPSAASPRRSTPWRPKPSPASSGP